MAAAGSSAWILIGRERSRVLLVYCVDPCAGVECSVGQVCQLDPQTRRALRRTERVVEDCRFCCMTPDWSRAVTCVLLVYCVDPCAGVECSVGQVCQLDPQTRRAVCRCGGTGPGGQCPMIRLPVCASDGRTYENECLMRVSACKRRRTDVRTLFRKECSAGKTFG